MTDQLAVKGTLVEVFRSRGIGPVVMKELDCTDGLVKYIESAKRTLVFAIFSLTSNLIVDALIRAKNRGVVIYGIADNTQWGPSCDRLVGAGIDLLRAKKQHACMHLKVALIDGHLVALGSFNWTNNAQLHNDEVLLVTDSVELASICRTQIDQARSLNS